MRRPALAGFALALWASCGGGGLRARVTAVEPAKLDLSPPNQVTIRVEYHDDDGDLGGGAAEVHDCRGADLVTRLALPAIASSSAVAQRVAIAGELDLVVENVGPVAPGAAPPECAAAGLASPPAPDRLVFCVVLVDGAGHRSDPACTPAIDVTSP